MATSATTTWTLLLDALTQWRGGDSNPFTEYGGWIRNFEAWFNRRARVREMETSIILPLTSNSASLPSDYLAWRFVAWQGVSPSRELKWVHPKRRSVGWPAVDGPVEFFTIENNTLYVTPAVTGNILLQYYQKLPPLDAPRERVLLHFDGQDASTKFVDDAGGSIPSLLWTASGNAQLDTSDYVFGGSSLLLDGTGDFISTPDSASLTLGSENWHLHARIKPAVNGSYLTVCGQCGASIAPPNTSIVVSRSNTNFMEVTISDGSNYLVLTTIGTPIVSGAWYDIEVSRSGNAIYVFVNGQLEARGAFNGSVNDSSDIFSIGGPGAAVSDYFNGWIDEFMLAVGEPGHTADYSVETVPFDSIESNWLSLAHPDLYLAGCLYEGAQFTRDVEGMAIWKGKRDEIFSEVIGLSAQTQGEDAVRDQDYF